jgi:hypothetical protein
MPEAASIRFGILIALYFIILFSISLFRKSSVSSKKVYLFRAFFPSWRFYDNLGEVSNLSYRRIDPTSHSENLDGSSWISALNPLHRNPISLLFNPIGNYQHMRGSLLQQLVSDIQEIDENHPELLTSCVSYQLVQKWIENEIKDPQTSYQFKITSGSEEILVSPVLHKGTGSSQ